MVLNTYGCPEGFSLGEVVGMQLGRPDGETISVNGIVTVGEILEVHTGGTERLQVGLLLGVVLGCLVDGVVLESQAGQQVGVSDG